MRAYLKALVAVIALVVAVLGLLTAWIQLTKETVPPTPVIVVVTATVPQPISQSTSTGRPTESIPQVTQQPQQQTISNCLIYKAEGKGVTWELDIDVPVGEIAFVDAWGFDDRSGGVFVTITGPYTGHHKIVDGAFCGGIPANANYEPVKQQRLQQMQEPFQRISLP